MGPLFCQLTLPWPCAYWNSRSPWCSLKMSSIRVGRASRHVASVLCSQCKGHGGLSPRESSSWERTVSIWRGLHRQWLSRQEAGPIPREAPRTVLSFLLTPSVPKIPSDMKAVEMMLVQALIVSFLNYWFYKLQTLPLASKSFQSNIHTPTHYLRDFPKGIFLIAKGMQPTLVWVSCCLSQRSRTNGITCGSTYILHMYIYSTYICIFWNEIYNEV